MYFGPQGLPALQFAAAEWPSASTAVELLELHRRAGGDLPAGKGSGSGSGKALAALAFNDAEVLVDTVTEADHRGEAAALAEAYNKSALRMVRHMTSAAVNSQQLRPSMSAVRSYMRLVCISCTKS